jgi:hypothetical protein
MNSNVIAAMILATSLWAGVAALAVTGGPAPRTGEFWMSASQAKAKIETKAYPWVVRAAVPEKLALAGQ